MDAKLKVGLVTFDDRQTGRPRVEIPYDVLVRQYRDCHKSLRWIADYYHVSRSTIARRLHEYNRDVADGKIEPIPKD